MSFLKASESLVFCRPLKNVFRYAHVIADGRGQCNEHFNSQYKMNIGDFKPVDLFKNLNKVPLSEYKFPQFCLKYSQEDCVEHAVATGINESYPNSHNLLNANSKSFQVLPSFLLTFSNAIMLALNKRKLMIKDRTLQSEQFMSVYEPLKPEGVLCYELKIVDIIDKGKGTIFIFTLHGRDEDQKDIFFLENTFYEAGLDAKNMQYTTGPIVKLPQKANDHIFEFKTIPFSPKFFNPSLDDMKKSVFHRDHCRQQYDIAENFSLQPNCHGRYYLGAVIQQILGHFANGDMRRFEKVKTRYSNPVYPGNTIMTRTWKIKNRIHFDSIDMETGKLVLDASYLDLKPQAQPAHRNDIKSLKHFYS